MNEMMLKALREEEIGSALYSIAYEYRNAKDKNNEPEMQRLIEEFFLYS